MKPFPWEEIEASIGRGDPTTNAVLLGLAAIHDALRVLRDDLCSDLSVVIGRPHP